MKPRLSLGVLEPGAYQAMAALETYLKGTGLAPDLLELIRIRASQINGCTFCVDKHIQDAITGGESQRRINNLAHWRETPFFTEGEQVALALTEEVTRIEGRVSDQTYDRAEALFGPRATAWILMAAVTINAWNRIGVGLAMQPS